MLAYATENMVVAGRELAVSIGSMKSMIDDS
jgi:hypothetical protein